MLVYMDLVLILNFLVNFLLLLGTNCLSGFPPGYIRTGIAALLGSLYSGACMNPAFAFVRSEFLSILCLITMSLIAFGLNRSAIKRGALFVLLTMAMTGMAVASNRNHFGIIFLFGALLWILCRISFSGSGEYVPVELRWQGKKMQVTALRDTGNLLRDPITGEQVFVAGADVAQKLLGLGNDQLSHPVETLSTGAFPGMRLIPYHSVGHTGMMLGLRFPNAKVGNTEKSLMVAFAPNVLARGEAYQMLTGGNV